MVVIPAGEVDRRGLHVCNLAGMRRALAALAPRPDYVLTDGFRVDGLGVPGLAVWKGDQVAACVAAASVLAKVTRDRIMVELDERVPGLRVRRAQGVRRPTSTRRRCAVTVRVAQHRFSYVNVAAATPGCGSRLGADGVRRSTVSVAAVDSRRARGARPDGAASLAGVDDLGTEGGTG